MTVPDEKALAREGDRTCTIYADALAESAGFRKDYELRLDVVKAADMPFERSPDGLIKHIIHDKLGTRECCLDIYMQFLAPGQASGKHRHLSEEIFYVVEGEGHDLHWDLKFECADALEWDWEAEPKRLEWKKSDFVYIPPYAIHQHVNTSPDSEARIIVINNRIVKNMGFDWFEQVENAEGF